MLSRNASSFHMAQYSAYGKLIIDSHTLSGRIGSALAWHTEGHTFETQPVSKSHDFQRACAYASAAHAWVTTL